MMNAILLDIAKSIFAIARNWSIKEFSGKLMMLFNGKLNVS